eukprot:scaffold1959_cov403-Prasinococcus_capsulatus_cf.AAC.7
MSAGVTSSAGCNAHTSGQRLRLHHSRSSTPYWLPTAPWIPQSPGIQATPKQRTASAWTLLAQGYRVGTTEELWEMANHKIHCIREAGAAHGVSFKEMQHVMFLRKADSGAQTKRWKGCIADEHGYCLSAAHSATRRPRTNSPSRPVRAVVLVWALDRRIRYRALRSVQARVHGGQQHHALGWMRLPWSHGRHLALRRVRGAWAAGGTYLDGRSVENQRHAAKYGASHCQVVKVEDSVDGALSGVVQLQHGVAGGDIERCTPENVALAELYGMVDAVLARVASVEQLVLPDIDQVVSLHDFVQRRDAHRRGLHGQLEVMCYFKTLHLPLPCLPNGPPVDTVSNAAWGAATSRLERVTRTSSSSVEGRSATWGQQVLSTARASGWDIRERRRLVGGRGLRLGRAEASAMPGRARGLGSTPGNGCNKASRECSRKMSNGVCGRLRVSFASWTRGVPGQRHARAARRMHSPGSRIAAVQLQR